jgi:vacuolar-type H+-ATPase subunit I/STV1
VLDPKSKRNNVDNVITLIKKVEEISKSYEECEKKIQLLTLKNEEITNQNQSIIQEIYKKNDYSKKLETLLFFIIEMFLPKNTLDRIFSSSEEATKYQNMLKMEQVDPNRNIQSESFKTPEEINQNLFKNNFSEAFFQNIYEKLRESLQNGQRTTKK